VSSVFIRQARQDLLCHCFNPRQGITVLDHEVGNMSRVLGNAFCASVNSFHQRFEFALILASIPLVDNKDYREDEEGDYGKDTKSSSFIHVSDAPFATLIRLGV
jgi:hypothetical protein